MTDNLRGDLPEDLHHIADKLMSGIAGRGDVCVARFDRSEAAVMLWTIKALAEAHAALRPFAEAADDFGPDVPDREVICGPVLRDLRRARDILKG